METITSSARETQELGNKIGSSLKGGEILALTGDLGSGKTTFIQGLAQGLGVKGRIVSPTFILMRTYELAHEKNFYHIDLYRLEGNLESEIENLGIPDVWEKEDNITAIEWAEKIKDILPKNVTWIKFENIGGEKRKITINEAK
ncbi:MAG TPA: tRNA (adenosine(37)-N6)-threonylcarbamoyltransferase complex ATPase subunit type 1 TsaE [Patescibacteria group bacterium]